MKVKNQDIKQKGYDLATGMFYAIIHQLFVVCIIILLIELAGILLGSTDDSDASRWSRSGVNVHTDHKTGVQYLSTNDGGMIRRAEE